MLPSCVVGHVRAHSALEIVPFASCRSRFFRSPYLLVEYGWAMSCGSNDLGTTGVVVSWSYT